VQGGGLPKAVEELAGLGPGVDGAGGHRTLDRPALGDPQGGPELSTGWSHDGGKTTIKLVPCGWQTTIAAILIMQ
jgi:hypothetical protein